MLKIIGDAIKARLESLGLFKVVEKGFSKRSLQSPPSAVVFLVDDDAVTDSPSSIRRLTWEVAMMVSYIDPVKSQAAMEDIIDAVRPAFTQWEAVAIGCLPASVSRIRYEGVEETLLIYTARITTGVFPNTVGH